MANDSQHFRTGGELEKKGCRREGNVYCGHDGRYLPLYEAKMLHQFDHRWATYEGRPQELNAALPTCGWKKSAIPRFLAQPRYWVREDVVESAIPKYPEPLAAALQVGHRPSIQRVLCLWAAGYHFNRGEEDEGDKVSSSRQPIRYRPFRRPRFLRSRSPFSGRRPRARLSARQARRCGHRQATGQARKPCPRPSWPLQPQMVSWIP